MNKLLNKTKKGFTLVELLVVIAILAVLASVSVVGYLGFTTKARNSNAMTELAQVREILRGELVDGDAHVYKYSDSKFSEVSSLATTGENGLSLTYNTDSTDSSKKALTYTVTESSSEITSLTWDAVLEGIFTELADLKGTFYVDVNEGKTAISSIAYVTTAGGSAKWTIETDALDQGVGNTASAKEENTNSNKVTKPSA